MTDMNKNLLSPNKFRIIINRFPEVQFFAQRVPLPSVTMGTVIQFTPLNNDIPWPGDKLQYDDMIVQFLADEDLVGYETIYNWINTFTEKDDATKAEYFSDITIFTLNNNSNKNRALLYRNCFPYSISGGSLDVAASENSPITFDVGFKYNDFVIITKD